MSGTDRDAAAVERVLEGDVDAFRDLVNRHSSRLFALVGAILPEPGDREDVVQDAFVAAFSHLSDFAPERGSFRAWICRIARNRALNARKRRRPEPHADLPEAVSPLRHEPEVFDRLDRALASLSERLRQTFLLAELAELPHREVAELEGVALGTVKSRVARARERLRAALTRDGERKR